jgi:hypothetical protein
MRAKREQETYADSIGHPTSVPFFFFSLSPTGSFFFFFLNREGRRHHCFLGKLVQVHGYEEEEEV